MSAESLAAILSDPDWNHCQARVRELLDCAGVAVSDLLAACRWSEPGERRRALLLLAGLAPGREIDLAALLDCLDDACWPVREAAVLALGVLGENDGVCRARLTRTALRDSSPHVRAAAI